VPEVLLNVARVLPRSRVNGPGVRAVVWVQGCTIGCPGCFNPHTHPHAARRLFHPVELAERLTQAADVEGITLSGGEPFEQAEACARLAEHVQERRRSVVVFSGYTLEYLQRSALPSVHRLLEQIDLLIAGPYVERQATNGRGWLGSANQKLHFLTDRYTPADVDTSAEHPVVEAHIDGGQIAWSGFPDAQDNRWFEQLAQNPGATAPR
jgi:anaerobic ribonucleoside-triphosphate reductase activating protein